MKTVAGDLGAQRNAQASKYFDKKIKNAGSFPDNPLKGMGKVCIAMDPCKVSGPSTVGGVVGGLKDKSDYHGMKSGTK